MADDIKCDDCGRIYPDETKLERHIQNIHGEKLFPCDKCDQAFVLNCKLQIHLIRKHIKSRNFICDICEKGFVQREDLNIHIINKHTVDKPYKCQKCEWAFKRICELYRHQRTHNSEKNHQCPVCMKNFKCKSSVRNCLEVHSRPKQDFPCTWNDCKAILNSTRSLKSHLTKTHIAPKRRVNCNICSKDYASKSDLKRHTTFVHEKPEKKFECNICDTKLFTDNHLERHMQTHEGNNFQCWFPGCLTKRSTMYDLRHHFKKQHDEVRHAKDYIPVEERPLLTCDLCHKKIKAGPSPNTALRLHMKKHKDQSPEISKSRLLGSDISESYLKRLKANPDQAFGLEETSNSEIRNSNKIEYRKLKDYEQEKAFADVVSRVPAIYLEKLAL